MDEVSRFLEAREGPLIVLRNVLCLEVQKRKPTDGKGGDATALLHTLEQVAAPLLMISYVPGSLEKDFERTREELGQEYAERIASLEADAVRRRAELEARCDHSTTDDAFQHALLGCFFGVSLLLWTRLEPARRLRNQITEELEGRVQRRSATPGQHGRAARDERIRELARREQTRSTATVLKAAKRDPKLQRIIQRAGVRLTYEIVRAALKRKRRVGNS